MRTRTIRASLLVGPALAAALVPACSLFVDLEPLSNGEGGSGGVTGGAGGTGTAGAGTVDVASSTGTGGGPVSFRDDEVVGEFGAGTFLGTGLDQTNSVTLLDGDAGELVSRVFDAGAPATWTTLGWSPRGPYGKALPDGGATESYAEDSADMTANVLLLHLDGMLAVLPRDELADSSGLGYAAKPSELPIPFTTGRFDQAIEDTPDTYAFVHTATSPELWFGKDDFTWSLWVKTTENCDGNKVHLGVDDGSADTPHLWLGCTDSTEIGCPAGETGGRIGGTYKSNHESGDTAFLCGTTRINDGSWHHLAVVKQGFPDVKVKLHVDGKEEAAGATTWAQPIEYFTDPEFAVGAFSAGTYQAQGAFDEVAIWRRALSAPEIAAVFHRGALRLSFQVRGCASPDCADNPPFVGPGGDPGRAYVAPQGPGGWEQVVLDAVSQDGSQVARYLQYRASFESDALPAAPRLVAVEITGQTQ